MTEQVTTPDAAATTAAPLARPAPATNDVHRYPGSPPFGDSELDRLLFRGRTREIDEVLHSILSHDLLVVYAVSGMGKTSLLKAGVFEDLRQRDYFPVIVRFNPLGSSLVELIDAQIREAGETSTNIVVTRFPADVGTSQEPTTFWDLLAGLEVWKDNTLQRLVLVFDQFEELFTLGWSDEERVRFIEEFGAVVRRHRDLPDDQDTPTDLPPPSVKITLIIREDFLGQLETLAIQVPEIMHCRFRLEGLSPDQAEAAIREPAEVDDPRLTTRRFTYSPGAAEMILTFLRAKEERGSAVQTRTIDPSQLQIICQHIETSILPHKETPDDAAVEITESDLGGRSGLERIVGDFYRRVIETFPIGQRKSLRKLCETGLISQGGRRLSLEEGQIVSDYDVSKEALAELVNRRLLRSEPRVGSVYYELAHDTLTTPILDYHDEKRRARRRRAVILLLAGGAAAVLVAAVAAIVLLISGESEEEFHFETPTDDLYLVAIRPDENLDAAVRLTDPGGGTTEFDENESPGGRETLVIRGQAGGEWTAVISDASNDVVSDASAATVVGDTAPPASPDDFQASVELIPSEVVPIDGSLSDRSVTPDRLAGFEFEIPVDLPLFATSVTVGPDADLDAALQVINPSGVRVFSDRAGSGGVETVVVGGLPGDYGVVLNGDESSSGDFDITVREASVTPVGVGEEVQGTIESDEIAVYQFQLLEGQSLTVQVTPDSDLDATLDLVELDGTSETVDEHSAGGIEQALVGDRAGRYRAVVSGNSSSGSFDLTLSLDEKPRR